MEEKLEVFSAIQDAIEYLKLELNPHESSDFILNAFFYTDNSRRSILSIELSTNEEWAEDEEAIVDFFLRINYEFTSEGYEYARELQNFLFLYLAEELTDSYINAYLNEEDKRREKYYLLKVSAQSTPLSSIGIILTKAIQTIYPDIPDSAVNIDILDNEYSLIEHFYRIIK